MSLQDEFAEWLNGLNDHLFKGAERLFDDPDFVEIYNAGADVAAQVSNGASGVEVVAPRLLFQLAKDTKPTNEMIASRASLVVAWHFMACAKISFSGGDYKAAMSHYTHACFAAGAAGDRMVIAKALTKSRREAQKISKSSHKERNEAINKEIAKLPLNVLENTKTAAKAIEATDTYKQLVTPISDRQLSELIRPYRKQNTTCKAKRKKRAS